MSNVPNLKSAQKMATPHNSIRLITVVPYDPLWPQLFEEEAQRILEALGDNCIVIHHVGSTAVPGLDAKPILDIIPIVHRIEAVDPVKKAMEELGYEARGEYGIPFRRYFSKGGALRTHNVYIFEDQHPGIERYLKFRDWLRKHPEAARTYATLKRELAHKFPDDITAYTEGKSAFINEIYTKAGWAGLWLVTVLTSQEWRAAKHFRQKYFFDNVLVTDPYTWTFDHPQHVHFALYQGAEIVGYAHIQLWPERRAAIRIIVVDEAKRGQGLASHFLAQIERWLKTQGYQSLHTESSPAAVAFYQKHAYQDMPFSDPDDYPSDHQDTPLGKEL